MTDLREFRSCPTPTVLRPLAILMKVLLPDPVTAWVSSRARHMVRKSHIPPITAIVIDGP